MKFPLYFRGGGGHGNGGRDPTREENMMAKTSRVSVMYRLQFDGHPSFLLPTAPVAVGQKISGRCRYQARQRVSLSTFHGE